VVKQAHKPAVATRPGEKSSRLRQRQKLIDACISALHQHGPSRTTIDKVVSIADMSPGIVNFYFETKAALLVATLDYLAVEFEEKVLLPLAALRETPVLALRRLVELYLDPDIATPRKVSVWYAFWGEASARHEYSEICGKRDLAFADLVRDLMARLINQSGAKHLDADAVALGLIGSLEMIWQGIAFQDEGDIDRTGARQRCVAYLTSIFPAQFRPEITALSTTASKRPERAFSSSQVSPDACAKLLVAELSMAGTDAILLPAHWPGYSVLARTLSGRTQFIAVLAIKQGHAAAMVNLPGRNTADWLAIVVYANQTHRLRRYYVIPQAAIAPHACLDSDIESLFGEYENNFGLVNMGDPERP